MDNNTVKTKKTKKHEAVDTSSVEIDQLKEQLARTLADYSNLTKRVERERIEGKYLSKLVVVSRLLPVFDMFIDAQKHSGDAGLGIALKVLFDTLKEEGIDEIGVHEGDTFNHELHEAIETIENPEREGNTIAEVLMKGYKFTDGPVIRHAKVKVYTSKK